MSLPISEELLRDMSVIVVNAQQWAKALGMTDEQLRHPNAGIWGSDMIKQLQTSSMLAKAIRLNEHKNTSIEGYPAPTPPEEENKG